MSLRDCRLMELPKISDPRGSLTFVESFRHLPFRLERVFYLYDVPSGETRAGHALKTCAQLLIAVSGSFRVKIEDGTDSRDFVLNRPHMGLLIPPLVWREMEDFSAGAVCVVLASEPYDERGYFRHYDEYCAAVRR